MTPNPSNPPNLPNLPNPSDLPCTVLVACVTRKLDHPAPARDLYQSPWFAKARAYAERIAPASWFILSALYGLLQPTQIIEPYDLTLNTMRRPLRIAWERHAYILLRQHIPADGRLIILLAGQRYREFLTLRLLSAGYRISTPLAHLGIGQQLAWFDAQSLPSPHLSNLPNPPDLPSGKP